jgi:hypothetical protein
MENVENDIMITYKTDYGLCKKDVGYISPFIDSMLKSDSSVDSQHITNFELDFYSNNSGYGTNL